VPETPLDEQRPASHHTDFDWDPIEEALVSRILPGDADFRGDSSDPIVEDDPFVEDDGLQSAFSQISSLRGRRLENSDSPRKRRKL
jgi:hypothetical protein